MHRVQGAPSTIEEALACLSTLEHDIRELRHYLLAQSSEVLLSPAGSARLQAASGHPFAAAADRPDWEVTCLGRFGLWCHGQERSLCRSRRGQSVLQYLLASRGYLATTDTLVEAFWPQADPPAGTHNLQMAVHALRRALQGCGPGGGDDTVLFQAGCYLLNPALSIRQDVDRFRAAYHRSQQAAAAGQRDAAMRSLEEARACYAGEYLADRPYDDWAAGLRAALQDMQLSILSQLSSCYGEAQDWERAAGCCREILAVDPYREDAYRQLMRCQAAGDRLAEVHRTYHACQDLLRRDLQVDPAPATTLLYRQLLESRGANGALP